MAFQALFNQASWDSDATGDELSQELLMRASKKKKKSKNKQKLSEKIAKIGKKEKEHKTQALKVKKKQIFEEIVKSQVSDIISDVIIKNLEKKKKKDREQAMVDPKKRRLKKILKHIEAAHANGLQREIAVKNGEGSFRNGSRPLPDMFNGKPHNAHSSSSDSSDSDSDSVSSSNSGKREQIRVQFKRPRAAEPPQPENHLNVEDLRAKFLKNQKRQKMLEQIREKERERERQEREKMSKMVEVQPEKTLRQKMMEKLKAARFRFLNEQIYTTSSKEAQKIFEKDPDAFVAYHEGYRQQVKRWPLNPLDIIIRSIQKMPGSVVVADFGCGEAKLAKMVEQQVHSFDLVAINEFVTACNMAHTPLRPKSVDVAVFCLSLMGTDMKDYLLEANRVLKLGGLLKIAEVESRFANMEDFLKALSHFGFKKIRMDLSHNLFYFVDFKKDNDITNMKKLPNFILHPCMYKKR